MGGNNNILLIALVSSHLALRKALGEGGRGKGGRGDGGWAHSDSNSTRYETPPNAFRDHSYTSRGHSQIRTPSNYSHGHTKAVGGSLI